ncbi:hypothetical protein C4572_02080 [Candidatus Parcubacteria bacterium]|nr:MAG: hypothetical protein C4572_02080 [Candidatus Parcubacteria bacterium]
MLSPKFKIFFFHVSLLAICYSLFANLTFASKADKLKQKITERNSQIQQIQKEIEEYQKEIEATSKEASTLGNKIKNLEATGKKLAADIKLTQSQIKAAELNIEKLNLQIGEKSESISDKKASLEEFMRNLNEAESVNMIEVLLAEKQISGFFSNIEKMERFQGEINSNLADLKAAKLDMEGKKKEKEAYKKNMEQLAVKYSDQKRLVDINKETTNKLLKDTKNKESLYKQLLADRVAKQKAFEEEIRELEDQIRLEIDKNALPKAGSGVLKWPLDKVYITQYFGYTEFALAHAGLYNGSGHNGVDFRAAIGTPIKAAKEGVVTGVGDTDLACAGVSYGKWVLVKHANNLSTLYAHLSIVKVNEGQQMQTGQLVGYAGDTGYATGPHLHFGVFATEGIEVGNYKSKVCGTTMRLPLRTKKNAYLNPMDYL